MKKTVLARFNIEGNLRFLSHRETLKVFQRALVRAGLKPMYSKGFNPHLKLSLPLPRSVGVESDDELLCVYFAEQQANDDTVTAEEFAGSLSAELPGGCKLLKVDVVNGSIVPIVSSATYIFRLAKGIFEERLRTAVRRLQQSRDIVIERKTGGNGCTRRVNVGNFIDSAELLDNTIVVKCRISPSGTIRPDEIIQLADIDNTMLAGPVKRTSMQWR